MDKFWALLNESVIIQGFLTIFVTVMACGMVYQGKTVPEWLYILLGTAWGFYFGTKGQQVITRAATK